MKAPLEPFMKDLATTQLISVAEQRNTGFKTHVLVLLPNLSAECSLLKTLELRDLSLLRNHLLTRGLCQILVDLSPIVGVSWEFYFVCSFLPWDLGCAHFVDFTYGLYEITAARPAPPPGAWT